MTKFLVLVAVVITLIVGLNLAHSAIDSASHTAQTISGSDLKTQITGN